MAFRFFLFLSLTLVIANAQAGLNDGNLSDSPDPKPQGFQELSEEEITDGGLNYLEAQALIKKRNWAEAVIVLRSVLKETPGFLPATLDLARALVYSGRREEALNVLEQAVSRARKRKQGELVRRSQVVSRIFLTKATLQIYQEGVNALSDGRYRAALEHFEKALATEPDNVEVLIRIGQCLVLERDFDSAAERLRLARRLNPHEPEVRLWLGRAFHFRGEMVDALVELRAAQSELEKSELAPVWLAETLIASGQKSQAIQLLEQDTKKHPFHLMGLVFLAKLRLQTPLNREAESLWSARKELQLVLSRLGKYVSPTVPRFETELGLDLRKPEDTKVDAERLIQQIDGRIEERSNEG